MYRPRFSGPRTSWRWVVSFTTLPLYPPRKIPGTHWIGGWVDSGANLDNLEKKNSLTLPGLELRPLSRPAPSQSDIQYMTHITKYTWLNKTGHDIKKSSFEKINIFTKENCSPTFITKLIYRCVWTPHQGRPYSFLHLVSWEVSLYILLIWSKLLSTVFLIRG
jgi:hypothetical protein